jgi:hypothetical protein
MTLSTVRLGKSAASLNFGFLRVNGCGNQQSADGCCEELQKLHQLTKPANLCRVGSPPMLDILSAIALAGEGKAAAPARTNDTEMRASAERSRPKADL